MIEDSLKVKLTIKDNKLEEINQRMNYIMGLDIKKNENKEYLIPKELFADDKRVNDVIRYIIDIKDNKISIKTIEKSIKSKNDIDAEYYKNHKKIVIIIESPHRYEYTFDYKPIGPAQGKTGIMIEKNIHNILKKYEIKEGKYIVIISNPVQFQASLGTFYSGEINKSIRNRIWLQLYNIYENDFISRLKEYDPNYILNATTSDKTNKIKSTLKGDENLKNITLESSYHPSYWTNGKIKFKE